MKFKYLKTRKFHKGEMRKGYDSNKTTNSTYVYFKGKVDATVLVIERL